jgi:hypothetical protein
MTTSDTDIRWRNVWAHIKPYKQNAYDLETNTRKNVTEVFLEVRWEGERFTARYYVENDSGLLLFTLDRGIEAIDHMLIQYGFPPYVIRSGDEEEQAQQEEGR